MLTTSDVQVIAQTDWSSALGLQGDWLTSNTNYTKWTLQHGHDQDRFTLAQSGDIDNNMNSTLSVTIDLRGEYCLHFFWKVSSEAKYDNLLFIVDGTKIRETSGDRNRSWTEISYTLGSGMHKIEWVYLKDGSVTRNQDKGWICNITMPYGKCLELDWAAVFNFPANDSSAEWKTDAASHAEPWSLVRGTDVDGYVAQSGELFSNQYTTLSVTFYTVQDICLRFWWKVSSEKMRDELEFQVDGQRQTKISGEQDWRMVYSTIDAGQHTLYWKYSKDYSAVNGEDKGWIYNITSSIGYCPILPTLSPSSAPTPSPTQIPNGVWLKSKNCANGIIGTGFVNDFYVTIEEAKYECAQSCLERYDCFYADLYGTSTCYLHNEICGDWITSTNSRHQLWVRGGNFTYIDVGKGKCTVHGGEDPIHEYHHEAHGCERLCTLDPECTGYSEAFSRNCLLWKEQGIDYKPGETWADAHCMKKKSLEDQICKDMDGKVCGMGFHWCKALVITNSLSCSDFCTARNLVCHNAWNDFDDGTCTERSQGNCHTTAYNQICQCGKYGSAVTEATTPGAGAPFCEDTCRFANDGACDDGELGSSFSVCDCGTDCTDCGSRICYGRCPNGFFTSSFDLSSESDYHTPTRVFNFSTIELCADKCNHFLLTSDRQCTAFKYNFEDRKCIIKVKGEFSESGDPLTGWMNCMKNGCNDIEGTYEDRMTISVNDNQFSGSWIIDSRPEFFGNISSDCTGEVTFPDDNNTFSFEYENGTIYFNGRTSDLMWRKDVISYVDLGRGKCTVNGVEGDYEYLPQTRDCKLLCNSDFRCTGYQLSDTWNCMLWKNGPIDETPGEEWDQTHCMKKKDTTSRCESKVESNCCNSLSPCNVGEGGCNSDNDCLDNLMCGQNNCGDGMPRSARCCSQPNWISALGLKGRWITHYKKWKLVEDSDMSYIAYSGKIVDDQDSNLNVTIRIRGEHCLEFWWSVSSEEKYDLLRFYIDGTQSRNISGEVSWTLVKTTLHEGVHTLFWNYHKDASVSSGDDRGWISNFTLREGKCPSCYNFGLLYRGKPYGNKHFAPEEIKTYQECQIQCQGDEKCEYFSFLKDVAICELTNELTDVVVQNEMAISGPKYCEDVKERIQGSCPSPEFYKNNDGCNFTGECYYGKEMCCGEVYASKGCKCWKGELSCWMTEACMVPQCPKVRRLNKLKNSFPIALVVFMILLIFYGGLMFFLKKINKRQIVPTQDIRGA